MPNVEWEDIEHVLEAPDWHGGSNWLYLNSGVDGGGASGVSVLNAAGERYILDPEKCKVERSLRETRTFRPQLDGEIVHRKFAGGVQFDLAVELWVNAAGDSSGPADQPACGANRRVMYDKLSGQLYAIIRQYGGWVWAPSAPVDATIPDRRLDLMQLVAGPTQSRAGLFTTVEFSLRSPFPYAVNDELLTTFVADGGSSVLTNEGTAPFYPLLRVYGPTPAFNVTNDTTGEELAYLGAGSLPGSISIPAGDYADFDFWNQTAFLSDGVTRVKAGIFLPQSDFFPLVPGDNSISATGADVDVFWRIAWG